MTHESGCPCFGLKFISDLGLSRKKALLVIDLHKTEDEYRIQTPEGLAALTRIKYLHKSIFFFFTRNHLVRDFVSGKYIEPNVSVCSGARAKS